MRALTIKQPWASLIASGVKRIENRTWKPPVALTGQRIAIHAGAGWDANAIWLPHVVCALPSGNVREQLPRGRIICTAVIDHVVTESDDPFFVGPFGWVLRDIERIDDGKSIRGKLGLWTLPP